MINSLASFFVVPDKWNNIVQVLEDASVAVPVGLSGDWISSILNSDSFSDYDTANDDQYVRLAPVSTGSGNEGVNTDALFANFAYDNFKNFLISGAEGLQEIHTADLLIMRDLSSYGYVHKGTGQSCHQQSLFHLQACPIFLNAINVYPLGGPQHNNKLQVQSWI